MSLKEKIADWLLDGEVGESSRAMAEASIGRTERKRWAGHDNYFAYPYDPDDFRRCLLLIERIPEIEDKAFAVLRKAHRPWPCLVGRWDEIKKLFLEEWGPERNSKSAPKTYALMNKITRPEPS